MVVRTIYIPPKPEFAADKSDFVAEHSNAKGSRVRHSLVAIHAVGARRLIYR
jgi:hypothetical protein